MPGEASVDDKGQTSFRWWFLPSWLGLDAPCVVSTWTWATSTAMKLPFPVRVGAALFLVVWCIYLADRLIDVARCRDWTKATGRLRFGRTWQPLFWTCLSLCCAGVFGLLWTGLPTEVLQRGSIVALGVCLHCLAFVTPLVPGAKLRGKEFGVGLFFALGAYACLGATLQSLPLFGSIAAVVAFNCLIIAARDSDSDLANDDGAASNWWRNIHRDLLWIGIALTVAALLCSLLTNSAAFYLALAAAFALLTALHRASHRLSGDALRAMADFALFTPLPVMLAATWR